MTGMAAEVRLYSKPSKLPVDVVAPQHAAIHIDLERWGWWSRASYDPATCASMEKLYYRGGRDATTPATAPRPPDPQLVAVDLAWRLMVRRVPAHGAVIHRYYIVREEPTVILRRLREDRKYGLVLHNSGFERFMGTARSMVINIRKELDG